MRAWISERETTFPRRRSRSSKSAPSRAVKRIRAQLEEAKRKAAEEQAKKKGGDTQVKITPKISVTSGSGSKLITVLLAAGRMRRVPAPASLQARWTGWCSFALAGSRSIRADLR